MENDTERYHYLEDEIYKLTNRVKELEIHTLVLYKAIAATLEIAVQPNYNMDEVNTVMSILNENAEKIDLDIKWNH